MTNTELLKEAGWFEKDGWLCNPKLNGEAVFKLDCTDNHFGDIDNKPLSWVLAVISATAFNAGSRWQHDRQLEQEVRNLKQRIRDIEDQL